MHVATQGLLDRFLSEIKRIARLKKGIEDSRKEQESKRQSAASDDASAITDQAVAPEEDKDENAIEDSGSESVIEEEDAVQVDGDWVPGQDVHIDYPKILDILVGFVDTSFGELHSNISGRKSSR